MNNYDIVVYRVDSTKGQGNDSWTKDIRFFTDTLDYFDHSDTGYSRQDAKKYLLNIKDFKVFDPMKEWKDELSVNTWSDIRCSEEFAIEKDLIIADYLDDIDYDDPDEYHEVLIDTDSLAMYGRDNGYDVTIIRDIPSEGGSGEEFTEYAVHNSRCVKIVNAMSFNRNSDNITEDMSGPITDNGKKPIKREPTVYLYRGTSEGSFSKKYDKAAGLFFSIKRDYVTGWGEVKRYTLKKDAKIYQGDASSDEFVSTDYFNKKYPEIQKYFGMYFSKPIQTLKEISDIFDNNKERKELDDKVVELCGDNFCNYDVWSWCDQLVARIELEKQGYDGAKWTHEDFGNPVQYQIWNLDVLKSSDGIVEDLTKGQEEFFKDSKVRDENGNLLVCYHGTHTPGFKEFDASKGDSKFGDYKFNKNLYSSYNVNYFTTDRKSAASYTELGYEKDNNVYACYINIVNPYIVNNKTEKDMRSSFNIKDDNLRQYQIELFDNIWNKWNDKVTWNYDSEEDFDSSELEELNNDLRKLNLELREDGEYYSLYTLGNNSMFGQEHPIELQYTVIELFDDDMYDQLKEDILGISDEYGDDYYFSTDDVVRYVLSLNETKGTNYDGIIIPDILDSMDMFCLRGTDVITLQSSSQIKLIDNENPTSSTKIDEGLQEIDNEGNKLSQEQINFFKDSKIREDGKLLVVYHETNVEFNTFAKGDIGFHFGTKAQAKNRGDIIKSYYLNITNPLYYSSDLDDWNYKSIKEVLIGDITEKNGGYVWIIGHQHSPKELSKFNITSKDLNNIESIKSNEELRNFFLSKGIDGIIYYNDGEDSSEGRYSYIAFESNQIKLINNENPTSSNRVDETYESNEFKLGTAGYIKEDGTFIYVDEYHGEESSLRDSGLPEFSNTHSEDDTCVRIYKEPNEIQYDKLESIIDEYLNREMYCKVEIWENHSKYNYYEIFSLYEGACQDDSFKEKVGNWMGYDLVQKIKNYFKGKLRESLLLEKTRQELINKSKNADNYKDQSKGKNRYERRLKSRIANSVAQYNKIDMDAFFKRDILTVGIDVQGETDNYVVTMRFNGVLKEIQRDVKDNNDKLEFKIIARAMSRVYNSGDVRLHCTCPDWKYRQAYWADKGGYGTQYEPRPSDITNPKDSKGGGCKHSLLVMGNLDWMMKVSSVINNYIKYCQNNLQNNYATYMFPKIYGMPYNKAVQLSLFDTGLLPSDQETLTTVATTNLKDKDEKGRWIGGNSYRFKSTKPQLKTPEVDDKDTNKFELQKDRNGKPVLTYDLGNGRNTLGRFSKGNQFAKKSPNLDSKKQEQDVKEPEVTDTKKKQLSIFDDEEEI